MFNGWFIFILKFVHIYRSDSVFSKLLPLSKSVCRLILRSNCFWWSFFRRDIWLKFRKENRMQVLNSSVYCVASNFMNILFSFSISIFSIIFNLMNFKEFLKQFIFINNVCVYVRLTSSSCFICSCAISNWLFAVNFSRNRINSGGQRDSSNIGSDKRVFRNNKTKFKH